MVTSVPAIIITLAAQNAGTREFVISLRYPEIMGAIMAEVITVQLKKPDAAPIFPGYLILTISPIQATITEIMEELLSIPYIIRVIIIPGKEVTFERINIMTAERGNTRIVTIFLFVLSDSRPQKSPAGMAVIARSPVKSPAWERLRPLSTFRNVGPHVMATQNP